MVSAAYYYQYRTMEHLYVLKAREDVVDLKVYNVAQECLFNRRLSFENDLSRIMPRDRVFTNIPRLLLELKEKGLLPSEHCFISRWDQGSTIDIDRGCQRDTCLEVIDEVIRLATAQIPREGLDIHALQDPIGMATFSDPVVDNHGHTFERANIEEWLRRGHRCPINRGEVTDLVPNFALGGTIEELNARNGIPTRAPNVEDDENLASGCLALARTFLAKRRFDHALVTFRMAMQYTDRWEDYALLPQIYEAMGAVKKACVARYYLVRYQVEAGAIQDAIQTLDHGDNDRRIVEKVYGLGVRQVETMPHDQAFAFLKFLIHRLPTDYRLYFMLCDLEIDEEEKMHLVLKGVSHALAESNTDLAHRMYEKVSENVAAKGRFYNLVLDLDRGTRFLSGRGDERVRKFAVIQMGKFFSSVESSDSSREALRAGKMVFHLASQDRRSKDVSIEMAAKVAALYERVGKVDKAKSWQMKSFSSMLEGGQWNRARDYVVQRVTSEVSAWKKSRVLRELGEVCCRHHCYREAMQLFQIVYLAHPNFESAKLLAETALQSGDVEGCVQIYYNSLNLIIPSPSKVIERIVEIDPQHTHLSHDQRARLRDSESKLSLEAKLKQTELEEMKWKIRCEHLHRGESIEDDQVDQMARIRIKGFKSGAYLRCVRNRKKSFEKWAMERLRVLTDEGEASDIFPLLIKASAEFRSNLHTILRESLPINQTILKVAALVQSVSA